MSVFATLFSKKCVFATLFSKKCVLNNKIDLPLPNIHYKYITVLSSKATLTDSKNGQECRWKQSKEASP
jgi:hypothetical protein